MRMSYGSVALACTIAASAMLSVEARAQMAGDDSVVVAPSRAQATLVPDVSAVDLRGRTWSLRSLRGRPVILSLFATWCPACRAEMGELDALQKKYGPSGLVVLAVSKESSSVLSDFARSSGHSVPVLTGSQAMMDAFGLRAWPTTFFIGSDSRVLARVIGTSPSYTRLLAKLAQGELASAAPTLATARRPSSTKRLSKAQRPTQARAKKRRSVTSQRPAKSSQDDGVILLSNSGRRVLR